MLMRLAIVQVHMQNHGMMIQQQLNALCVQRLALGLL